MFDKPLDLTPKNNGARLLLVGALVLAIAQPLIATEAVRARVAVLTFKNAAAGYQWAWYDAGGAVQDIFIAELVSRGDFRVIERAQLQTILQEKGLPGPVGIDPKTTIEIGKMLGVDYIVTGTVVRLGATVRETTVPAAGGDRLRPRRGEGFRGQSLPVRVEKLDAAFEARAFSAATGEAVWAHSVEETRTASGIADARGTGADRIRLDKLMRPAVSKLTDSLLEKNLPRIELVGTHDVRTPMSTAEIGSKEVARADGKAPAGRVELFGVVGKIAEVDGHTLYLNVGFDARIKVGDELDVFRVVKQIKDPDTGDVLGVSETKVGRVRITSVKGPRLSTAESLSGTGFRMGDRLKN